MGDQESLNKLRSLIILRQVVGNSMYPTLKEGKLLIFTKKFKLKPGNVVVAKYNNKEIVKRIKFIDHNGIYIVGDNQEYSTDSRTLGKFKYDQVIGKLIWPKLPNI